MKPARVFFYVQHLLGIGHLVRASRIARALAEGGFEVTMAVGGAPIEGFPGEGIAVVALPAIKAAAGFAHLEDMDGKLVTEEMKTLRRDALLNALHRNSPDIVIIEAFPFGRRQMRFELLPLIEAVHRMQPRPLLASSVRDILQDNRKPGRAEETAGLVRDYFDLVLVHGDPNFVRFEETFPLADEIADKIVYTGLVAGWPPHAAAERFDIVASAGGGAAGAELVQCAVEAARQLADDLSWCLITGPNLPPTALKALAAKAPSNVLAATFRKDFPNLLQGARLSISQAGYNTVCDVLQANCPALLIPFAAGGESEQTIRSRRLQALGLATILPEQELSAEHLRAAISAGLTAARPAAHGLNLRGAAETREILRHCVTKD